MNKFYKVLHIPTGLFVRRNMYRGLEKGNIIVTDKLGDKFITKEQALRRLKVGKYLLVEKGTRNNNFEHKKVPLVLEEFELIQYKILEDKRFSVTKLINELPTDTLNL